MSVPPRKNPPVTNRERVIRLVTRVLESPIIQETPFGPMVMMWRGQIYAKLRKDLDEATATTVVRDLRELLK